MEKLYPFVSMAYFFLTKNVIKYKRNIGGIMYININGNDVEVIITKKLSNKNTYLRVKEDLKIYVTTNYFTKEKEIEKIIENNKLSIEKM